MGREGCKDEVVAYLGSAVLRHECRGLFVPGLTAQNWGSPCKHLPSQTPPRTRPQPPSLWSPEHSQRRLCSYCSAHEILMRERLAGGGARTTPPPPLVRPWSSSLRPCHPTPYLLPPPEGLGGAVGCGQEWGEHTAIPATQRGEPSGKLSLEQPGPLCYHGNACRAGLCRLERRMEGRVWRATADSGSRSLDPGYEGEETDPGGKRA